MISSPSLSAMLEHINMQVPQFVQLVTALSYVIGISLFLVALHKFKQYGEMRGSQSGSADLRTPVVLSITAAFLLFLPSTFQAGFMTLWNSDSPLAYSVDSASDSSSMMNAVLHIVQALGVISTIRGIMLLSKANSQGAQGSGSGKGVTHFVAGILAVNIYGTWSTLMTTVGFSGM